jgi:hypothetical protein
MDVIPRRNALRIAREAEDTARGTVSKLADQSGLFCHPVPRPTTIPADHPSDRST